MMPPEAIRGPIDSPELLARAQAGDGESFCKLCELYEDRLLRQAFVLCQDLALAEDLTQDTWVQAWKGIHKFRGRCQFFTWVCSILLHRHHSWVRRKRLTLLFGFGTSFGQTNAFDHLVDETPTPEQATLTTERTQRILKFLQQLPAKQREVVLLRFYVGEPLEGIASALGCSIGTVKSRLFYALENLRHMRGMEEELP